MVVDLDFDSVERAESFRQFLQNQVWSSPTSAPALAGQPHTLILQPAPAGQDARDALHLARLLRLDEITPVAIPSVEQEAAVTWSGPEHSSGGSRSQGQ